MEQVRIVKHKLPNATGVFGAYVVAEDEFGTWFFTPAQTSITWTNLEGKSTEWEFDVLTLAPPNDWYYALWWGPHPHEVELSVDVSTPPVRNRGECSWIDLEIDLFRLKTGDVGIEDEDEFEDSVAKGYITDEQRTEALRITPVIERMLRDRTEPFGDVGRRRLNEAVALGLPPI